MPADSGSIAELNGVCLEARKWIIRMIGAAGTGHVGGSLSCVEILVSLYFHQLRIDPSNPHWPGRDRLVLSKGHGGPALYAVTALRGYLSTDELYTLDQPGTRLSKHVDRVKLPACDCSAGMLGQGLSVGVGMALGARMTDGGFRVYVVLGDGEIQEGQVWEAAMCAAKYRLSNLTAILDRNHLQVDGPTEEVMPIESVVPKWRAFGWHVLEVDGHDVGQLLSAYDQALARKNQPTIIVAETVKGKGVTFAEGKTEWHSKTLEPEQVRIALEELEAAT